MSNKSEIAKREQGPVAKVNGLDVPKPFLKWKYKLNEETGKKEFQSLELSDGSELDGKKIIEAIQQASGTSDPSIGEKIIKDIAYGLADDTHELRINSASAMLSALKPKDETEALLLGQFFALHDSGMRCLRNANSQEMFYHIEKLFSLSAKLLNTANQSMQALIKYRSGGQQTVQVIHMHNEGQAIVAQNLSRSSAGEGVQK